MEDRSVFVRVASRRILSNMGGTPTKNVIGRRLCASRAICASNFGSRTWVAALRTDAHRKNVSPKAWKYGSSEKKVSAPSCSFHTQNMHWLTLTPMLRCVRGADLGMPFVPDVCRITARSSGEGSGNDGSMGADEAVARSHDRVPEGTEARS